MGISPYCGSVRKRTQATGALPLDPMTLLKKGQSKTFIFLTGFTAFNIKPQSVERIMVLFSEKLQTFKKQNRRHTFGGEVILSSGLEAKAEEQGRNLEEGSLDMCYLAKRTMQKNYGFQRFAEPRQNRRPHNVAEVILSSGLEAKAEEQGRNLEEGSLDMCYLAKRTMQKNYGFQRFAEPRQNRRPHNVAEVILSSGLEA